MKSMRELLSYFTVVILFVSTLSFPAQVVAADTENNKAVVFSNSKEDIVQLLKDNDEGRLLASIPDNTEVTVLEEGKAYTYIIYTDQETGEKLRGYVDNKKFKLVDPSQVDQFLERRQEENMNLAKSTDMSELNVLPDSAGSIDEKRLSDQKDQTMEDGKHPGETDPEKSVSEENFEGNVGKITDEGQSRGGVNQTENTVSDEDVVAEGEHSKENVKPNHYKDNKSSMTKSLKVDVQNVETFHGIALKSPTHVFKETSTRSGVWKSYNKGSILKYRTSKSDDWYEATVKVDGKWRTGYIKKSDVENKVANQKTLRGIGLKNPTRVYKEASRDLGVWKSYNQGSVLKYKTFTSDWYEATVYVDGERVTGYIKKSDVENVITDPKTLYGISVKSPTHVYMKASTKSGIWKSYERGTDLKYKTFTSGWYKAKVKVDGDWKTGYIKKNDVENKVKDSQTSKGYVQKNVMYVYAKPSPESKIWKFYNRGESIKYRTFTPSWYEVIVYAKGGWKTGYIKKEDAGKNLPPPKELHGIASKTPTHVYTRTSKRSQVLKSYNKGSILKYRSHKPNWYEATVKVDGKWRTGYIKKSDVENKIENQKTLHGIGLKSPTRVYKEASRDLGVWKSYDQGSILKYETFTLDWYEATVKIDGKWRTGYIKKSDVENKIKNQKVLRGIGLKSPTRVYKEASKDLGVWKSYRQGSILKYKTFTSDWYEATVKVDGKWRTGYIKKSDVDNIVANQEVQHGIALKRPTKVYAKPSRNSKVRKSYSQGSTLKYWTFTSHWYEAKVKVNGKWKTGYISANDVGNTLVTNYEISFDRAVDMQMKANPKADGAGRVPATREEVEYYLNPNNFDANSSGYFQFLRLSTNANLDKNEVNQEILKGKGILSGRAEAFIRAANEYEINELYLISHALHETGNGKSRLANGIKVNGTTVYNMYGIGAKDSCDDTVQCGAQFAYDQGWDTPRKAIIGGAKFVSVNYIQAGQDTLYKMRWNPLGMVKKGYANHQYATHVAWAVIQARKIKGFYDQLDFYTLVFDVPRYKK